MVVKSIKHNENPAIITKTISDGLQQTKMLQKKGENCYVVNITITAATTTARAEENKGKRKQKRVISTDIDT